MVGTVGKYKSFIIHLGRSKGRMAQVQDLSAKSPFEVEIVDAVDGSKLTAGEIDTCFSAQPLFQPKYPFGLNTGEIGCFLSHRTAWQKIVDQDLTAGLILEDDVQLDPMVFDRAIEAAKKWSASYGYIQFQVRDVAMTNPAMEHAKDVTLLRPIPVFLRTSAQLVSRDAAQHLLDIAQKFDRPIDTFLQMGWATGMWPVSVVPSGVTDRTQEIGGSTISQKKSLRAKFVREIKRANYRSAVKRYSKKAVLEGK